VISTKAAAEVLRVTVDHVQKLIPEGRLNAVKEGGRWMVLLSDVKRYAALQGKWASAGGKWTPYGKREKQHGGRPMVEGRAVPRSRRRFDEYLVDGGRETEDGRGDGRTRGRGDQTEEDRLILVDEAAAILGVSAMWVHGMAAKGMLSRTLHLAGEVEAYRGPSPQSRISLFSLREVTTLAAERERRRWRSGISPKQWKEDLRHPLVRTEIVAPPGDRLISRADAAAFLDVS
jgi:excisionase family DNA binding protein